MSEAASAERPLSKSEQAAQSASQQQDAANRVAELQVSAHLMTLETGLFCVFQTPGSPQSDPATGLPGVRITPAPGIAGRPEAVSVSTFREDGWLNGTAALVRVTDGSAQILVTIYQHKGMDAAPRLQVLRLSGEPNAASAAEPAPAARNLPMGTDPAGGEPSAPVANPEVMAHIQRMGDVSCSLGEWLGHKGSRQWVEGFGMAPLDGMAAEDLEYQAVLGRNWLSPWVEAGKFCGSRGMALPLLGLKVRLKGAAAKALECSYSATFVDGTAVGPVNAGDTCEADSLAAMESFQIVIHPRGSGAASAKQDAGTNGADRKAPAGKKLAVGKQAAERPAAAGRPQPAKVGKPSAKARAKA
ncbi:MAG: hypothetical protein QOF70_444 [Acetobacteraceae bacterium]|jgi:hypothetical protein|nr:hypothetical protein [Rhodopila sp.]MEA2725969.1 hypothetical protein [Acetobacteraceae bacterium]